MEPDVAPFAGAWIEIMINASADQIVLRSLPSRERGLKSNWNKHQTLDAYVAPFAGAWIEMIKKRGFYSEENRRSLRGSVD